MTFRTEFPDFDPATMPALPQGFTDESWRNDVCPVFRNHATGMAVWIDFADPAQREHPDAPRFSVQQFSGDDLDCGHIIDTNDWTEVLRAIAGPTLPPKGARVRLAREVDRFPDFVAPAGLTGTVVESSETMFAVRMDAPLAGAEEWDNEVCWNLPAEPAGADIEVLS